MSYTEKLRAAIKSSGSTLCVGLDPVPNKVPRDIQKEETNKISVVRTFCQQVIDATRDYCCAYKPNLAFFESLGKHAFQVLSEVRDYIPDNKIVIADAKRGDISSTGLQYRKTYFDWLDVDAITLNPLMGFDTLEPYFGYPEKAIYVLTLTSNKGAADFFLNSIGEFDSTSLYIADRLSRLSAQTEETHLAMVVGATQNTLLENIINNYPDGSLLIPGIGKQGGQVKDLVDVLNNHTSLPVINASRSIIYAREEHLSWKEAVQKSAKSYYEQLKPITEKYVK